jgi:hypothetical protein
MNDFVTNRNVKSLSLLALLLFIQPSAHCFSWSFAKTAVVHNFNLLKPYVTVDNVSRALIIGAAASFFGYIIFSSYKNQDNVQRSEEKKRAQRKDEIREKDQADRELICNCNKDELRLQVQFIILKLSVIKERSIISNERMDAIAAIKKKVFESNQDNDTNLNCIIGECRKLLNAIKDYNHAVNDTNKPNENLERCVKNIENICAYLNTLLKE